MTGYGFGGCTTMTGYGFGGEAKMLAESLRQTLEQGHWPEKTTIAMACGADIGDKEIRAALRETGKFPKCRFHARSVENFHGGRTVLVTRHKM